MIARIAAVTVAALLAAWALLRFAYEPYRCNVQISKLTARTDGVAQTASDYERLLRARANLRDLEPLRTMCPTEVRVPMLIGANEELVGRPDDALRRYREALEIEQRPEIHVAIAQMQIELGRVDEAIDSYVRAARFAPHGLQDIRSEEVRRRVTERLRASDSSERGKLPR